MVPGHQPMSFDTGRWPVLLFFDFFQCRHGRDSTVAAGGDAGSFIGKGQNAFQLVHRQSVQLLLAELGRSGPKEGIACAVDVAYLAGSVCHTAGLVPKAVEYAVCTQGDENQPDAILGKLGCALGTVGGAGKQGQLLIGHFQDIHQRQGSSLGIAQGCRPGNEGKAPPSPAHLMQKRALIAMQYSALHNRTWKTPTVQKPCRNRAPMAYKTKKP